MSIKSVIAKACALAGMRALKKDAGEGENFFDEYEEGGETNA